ncbi:MAG: hypothetical protein KZQ93_21085 [Candidatus Thiodiazotropha sp. (ex Monitilora ramsayi)]|nr:hypothetical protein [Candidatus Thiodiazotropha sp. (ex Monitilora ramsayi)]
MALLTLTQAMASNYAESGILVRDAEPGATKTVMTKGEGMPFWLVLSAILCLIDQRWLQTEFIMLRLPLT